VFPKASVAIYKGHIAIVDETGDKYAIKTEAGESVKVREKDLALLHPGPVQSLHSLLSAAEALPSGDMDTAWSLLEGRDSTIEELCELAWGKTGPEIAVACWRAVQAGPHFSGGPLIVKSRTKEEIDAMLTLRAVREAERERYAAFLARAKQGKIDGETDGRYIQELESIAYSEAQKSKLAKDLGLGEGPEGAHAFLLKAAVWDRMRNPAPRRHGAFLKPYAVENLPPRDDSGRVDLTRMEAYAIDSVWSHDPDDAVSFHEGCLWVHVADPASAIAPGSDIDREARARGSTLYLPEGAVRMLPDDFIPAYALGLSSPSPALSFKIQLGQGGEVAEAEVMPSWVRVSQLSYAEAEAMLGSGPLSELMEIARKNEIRRTANGAVSIDIPEAHLSVDSGKISIEPIARHQSSMLVREAMLLAGEAASRLALRADLPFPFVTQAAPETQVSGVEGLAREFATRKTMRGRLVSTQPGQHAGLGLGLYSQVTSPLRRYTDLIAHYQLRALALGRSPLSREEVESMIAEAELASQVVRKAERDSDTHWTLAYLEQEGERDYEAVIVDSGSPKTQVFIPSLSYETKLGGLKGRNLNERIKLRLKKVDLARSSAIFDIE
jgi:exoribonuclease II